MVMSRQSVVHLATLFSGQAHTTLENLCTRTAQLSRGGCSRRVHKMEYLAVNKGLSRPKQFHWKDTNLALFGSKDDRLVKKSSAEKEAAWKNAGSKPGLQVWRIVKFKVTDWPVEDYGKFYDGDSYVILNTHVDPEAPGFMYDVHFWIGKYSTPDEYETAKYKTVELDTYLDDKPVQHREVQGHESTLFRSYFPTITILRGGADSGFRRVEAAKYEPRLLWFHGEKKQIQVTEITRSRCLLDHSDVYILDLGTKLYQWNGAQSNKDERFKAAHYMNNIKEEKGKCTTETLDDGDPECEKFYNHLDEAAEKPADEEQPKATRPIALYRLSDASGEILFKKEKEGNITVSDLDTKDVFILDTMTELFVWIGNQTTENERGNAMTYAHNYLTKTDHPLLPITCVIEGKRNQYFDQALTI